MELVIKNTNIHGGPPENANRYQTLPSGHRHLDMGEQRQHGASWMSPCTVDVPGNNAN
jgi:hypothetical protein